MHTYATMVVLALLLPVTGLSQQSKSDFSRSTLSTPMPEKVKNTVVEHPDKIKHVSSNTLSLTLTAHTYKLVESSANSSEDTDQQPAAVNSEEIQNIIDAFTVTDGVSRCTYDQATATFTILSKPGTDLSITVNSINK